MDNGLGEYLQARRAQVRPEHQTIGRRRVPGLRRAELAERAGISEHYLVRLEQGRDRHPSDQVLTALARALHLDEDATEHLRRLATPPTTDHPEERLADGLQELLDAWSGIPAYIRGRHFDVLASNALARALVPAHRPGRNLLRDVFLDEATRAWHADWPSVARSSVGALRAAVGAAPADLVLRSLVQELTQASNDFRDLWSGHDVRPTHQQTKLFNHPELGVFPMHRHVLHVDGAPGQVLIAYRPTKDSEQVLKHLDSRSYQ